MKKAKNGKITGTKVKKLKMVVVSSKEKTSSL